MMPQISPWWILLYPIELIVSFVIPAFWLWMLIDCVTYTLRDRYDYNEKLGWILFILLVPPLGALVYFLTSRRRRLMQRIS